MGFNGSIVDVSHAIEHFPRAVRQELSLSVIVRYGENIHNSGHSCSVLTREAKASSKTHPKFRVRKEHQLSLAGQAQGGLPTYTA